MAKGNQGSLTAKHLLTLRDTAETLRRRVRPLVFPRFANFFRHSILSISRSVKKYRTKDLVLVGEEPQSEYGSSLLYHQEVKDEALLIRKYRPSFIFLEHSGKTLHPYLSKIAEEVGSEIVYLEEPTSKNSRLAFYEREKRLQEKKKRASIFDEDAKIYYRSKELLQIGNELNSDVFYHSLEKHWAHYIAKTKQYHPRSRLMAIVDRDHLKSKFSSLQRLLKEEGVSYEPIDVGKEADKTQKKLKKIIKSSMHPWAIATK